MISFIIPAHNADKTLERAVLSIEKNVKVKKEVIIVENASTDKTLATIDKLRGQYSDIKFAQTDRGVSRARNRGIQMAVGTWLCFVDADDYLTEGVNALFLEYQDQKQYDAILFSYNAGSKTRKIVTEERAYQSEEMNACIQNMLGNPTLYMQVWSKLIKRSVVTDGAITFEEELRVAEDSDFMLHFLVNCQSVMLSPKVLYQYVMDTSSTMRSYSGDKLNGYIASLRHTSAFIGRYPEYKASFDKYILIHFNIAMVREVYSMKCTPPFYIKYQTMKSAKKVLLFHRAIHTIKIRECVSKRFLPFLFLKLHLPIFAALLYVLRAYANEKREQP